MYYFYYIFTAEVSKYSNPYDLANSSASWILTERRNDKSILLPIKTPVKLINLL